MKAILMGLPAKATDIDNCHSMPQKRKMAKVINMTVVQKVLIKE